MAEGESPDSPEILDKSKILKEIGEKIRTKREGLGLSIQEVQERTKIRSMYLLAVEKGDDSISPGKAYFRAFLKTYANFLGLNGTQLSKDYWALVEQEEAPVTEGKPEKHERRPGAVKEGKTETRTRIPEKPESQKHPVSSKELSHGKELKAKDVTGAEQAFSSPSYVRTSKRRKRRSVSSLGTLLVILLVFAVALGAWFLKEKLKTPPEPTPPVGSEEGNGKETLPKEPSLPSKPEPSETKITKIEPNDGTTIFEADKGPLDLTVSVSSQGSCWISVKVDGKTSMEKTLSAGTRQEFKAEKEIIIRAGRPWDLNLTLNGKVLGAAGPFGPVKDLIFRVKR